MSSLFSILSQELMSALPEGEAKVALCEECAEKAMESTGLKGRQMVKQELDVLKLDWEDYCVKLSSLQDSLDKAVHHWGQYDDQYAVISQWVKDMERRIKDFPLKSTLEEKQEQLKRYQVNIYKHSLTRIWLNEKNRKFFIGIIFLLKTLYGILSF